MKDTCGIILSFAITLFRGERKSYLRRSESLWMITILTPSTEKCSTTGPRSVPRNFTGCFRAILWRSTIRSGPSWTGYLAEMEPTRSKSWRARWIQKIRSIGGFACESGWSRSLPVQSTRMWSIKRSSFSREGKASAKARFY